MRDRYLEITFRKGNPLAAYLYLSGDPGTRSHRTAVMGPGLLVDYGPNDEPIGLEITTPQGVSVGDINRVLDKLELPRITALEAHPLCTA